MSTMNKVKGMVHDLKDKHSKSSNTNNTTDPNTNTNTNVNTDPNLAQGQTGGAPQAGQAGGANAGKEDYADKGLDAAEKKFGLPENRNVNEKITDYGRDTYEKDTGKDVSSKISN